MTRDETVAVAVIGGGCASLAAAFELTRPEHQGRYRVTVYQLGWRLGGKGASGRGSDDRIEEHGLHLWMGFYENAFRLMRECYAEANRDPAKCRISDWRDAFCPDNFNAVADRSPSGRWLSWRVNFPPIAGLPGDPPQNARPWTVGDYVGRMVILARTLLESIQLRIGEAPPAAARPSGQPYVTTPDAVMAGISRMLRIGELATFGALIEALRIFQVALSAFPQYPESLLIRFQEAITAAVRGQLEALIARDDELRRLWEIVDLALAVVRGALRFQLMTDPRGFDAIDDFDCREWLRLNGASERSINSAEVRALYDLAFAYEDGDVSRPRIAAGTSLRGYLRAFFTYRGAFFWKMQSGMGDVVFAPLWEVLARRGVRFEFFHRLEKVSVADGAAGDRPYVDALHFAVQAKTHGGREYQPLVDVRGLPCWPSEPDWAQLIDGPKMKEEGRDFESHWDTRHIEKKTLRVAEDFDLVVLGIGIGAVPDVCAELVARDRRWRNMVDHVKSVPTQALQLWMTEDMSVLGWKDGPANMSGFVEPFDTWADMTHLVAEESHPGRVRSIGYFCSVLPDAPPADREPPSYPRQRHEEVKANAIRFLNRDIVHLWPGAADAHGFRWPILVDRRGDTSTPVRSGEARVEGQYWRANVNPTERYALSLPGTLRYRISPLDPTYDNLTIAGDWTECGLNQGCVEAAVMSGRLAAHAISKSPPLEEIVGYDHP
jgi:uncharacterized protein with NAD-binding domain and iron-sulfur cluster